MKRKKTASRTCRLNPALCAPNSPATTRKQRLLRLGSAALSQVGQSGIGCLFNRSLWSSSDVNKLIKLFGDLGATEFIDAMQKAGEFISTVYGRKPTKNELSRIIGSREFLEICHEIDLTGSSMLYQMQHALDDYSRLHASKL